MSVAEETWAQRWTKKFTENGPTWIIEKPKDDYVVWCEWTKQTSRFVIPEQYFPTLDAAMLYCLNSRANDVDPQQFVVMEY